MKRLEKKSISDEHLTLSKQQPGGKLSCAIYARSASSGPDSRYSIEKQVRECKQHARKSGWVVVDEFIRADIGLSGASISGREGLQSLLSAAIRNRRRFDCVLVADVQHLGRNLADVLNVCDLFESVGCSMRFAAQNLHSRDPHYRLLVGMQALTDEQYRIALRDKIRGGQRRSHTRRFDIRTRRDGTDRFGSK